MICAPRFRRPARRPKGDTRRTTPPHTSCGLTAAGRSERWTSGLLSVIERWISCNTCELKWISGKLDGE